jgi:hypothetical protein
MSPLVPPPGTVASHGAAQGADPSTVKLGSSALVGWFQGRCHETVGLDCAPYKRRSRIACGRTCRHWPRCGEGWVLSTFQPMQWPSWPLHWLSHRTRNCVDPSHQLGDLVDRGFAAPRNWETATRLGQISELARAANPRS